MSVGLSGPALIYNPFCGTIRLKNFKWNDLSDRLIRTIGCETNEQALLAFKTLTANDLNGCELYWLPDPDNGAGSPDEAYDRRLQNVNLKGLIDIAKTAIQLKLSSVASSSIFSLTSDMSGLASPSLAGRGIEIKTRHVESPTSNVELFSLDQSVKRPKKELKKRDSLECCSIS